MAKRSVKAIATELVNLEQLVEYHKLRNVAGKTQEELTAMRAEMLEAERQLAIVRQEEQDYIHG